MEAYVLTPLEIRTLDASLAKKMGAMMAGAAHVEREDGTRTSLTSRAVFEEWQVPPTVVELTIR
eukprot:6386753-Pyramimonas_sp.AAC.1